MRNKLAVYHYDAFYIDWVSLFSRHKTPRKPMSAVSVFTFPLPTWLVTRMQGLSTKSRKIKIKIGLAGEILNIHGALSFATQEDVYDVFWLHTYTIWELSQNLISIIYDLLMMSCICKLVLSWGRNYKSSTPLKFNIHSLAFSITLFPLKFAPL